MDDLFARRLKEVRAIAGLTQQQLADRVAAAGRKMFRSQIGKIESGDRPVTIGEATALADALGVGLADLVAGPGPAAQWPTLRARLAAETAVRSLTEQAFRHLSAMREHEVLWKDAEERLAAAKRDLAELLGEDDQ